MSFWNSVHVKSSRKFHLCYYCYRKIDEGSPCFHETGTYDGEFNDYYLCERCEGLISSGGVWYDGEELGSFHDSLFGADIVFCPNCGSFDFDHIEYSDDMLSCKVDCNCGNTYVQDLSIEKLLAIK